MNEHYLDAAIVFHQRLNPALWEDGDMKPEIRERLLEMAAEFQDFLGLDELDLVDITVSGSNAAYTYTPHSDIDLHLVVKIPKHQNQIYTELFDAKKNLYNRVHNQTIKGFDVEFYVQDEKNPVESIGIYSVLNAKWISVPKRIRATIDDLSVLSKVDSFTVRIHEVLASDDIVLAQKTWDDLKAMRKSGLEQAGEFSPENLAFKILRTRGLQTKLFDRIIELKDKQLSLESLGESTLNELFNRGVNYEIVASDETDFVTKSVINGREIVFEANQTDELDGKLIWEVVFSEIQRKENGFYNSLYGKTGSGGELEVLSMIKASLEEFIKRNSPDIIRFTADKDKGDDTNNRAKLYTHLLKRYMPPGYQMSTSDSESRTNFWIEKKQ